MPPSDRRHPDALMDGLEPRALLFAGTFLSEFPQLSELENPFNTVVRFQTNFGVIDIELFDTVAPVTAANFRKYVEDGAYDQMFFHRLVTDFVLQGGGFKFDDGPGMRAIDTEPPIQNEFQRLNLERTVAMAKQEGNPNSATSQFFINLQDNPNLNTSNGGFTVFGRVIRGWVSVDAIAGLQTRDMDFELTGSNPEPGTFENVPTGTPFAPPTEDHIVYVWDAEVIKPGGVQLFYTEAVYYPEGFRGPQTIERIDLYNPRLDGPAHYQIIARYENGDRDEVIARSNLASQSRVSIKLSDYTQPNNAGVNRVRAGVPYALEIRATRMVTASLNHRDFGVTLAEPFVNIDPFTGTWLKTWTFAHGENGPGIKSFLVWQNLTDKRVTVTVTIYSNTGAPLTFTRSLERYARGGLEVHTQGTIPIGRYSARVTCTEPIVAAQSVYQTSGSGASLVTNGAGASGTLFGGRVEGYLAAARVPAGGSSFVSILFTGATPASVVVDFTFYLQNGTVLATSASTGNPVTLTTTTRRVDRNLAAFALPIPANQFFSIGYKVRNNAAPVTVNYLSSHAGDWLSTPFTIASTATMHFSDGFMDVPNAGTTYSELISIFNPYSNAGVTFNYEVRFRFSDGSQVVGALGTLDPHGRLDVRANLLPNVLNKINASPAFRFYSITVATVAVTAQGHVDGAGVAQITRVHAMSSWQESMTSGPTLDERQTVIYMNAPQFD